MSDHFSVISFIYSKSLLFLTVKGLTLSFSHNCIVACVSSSRYGLLRSSLLHAILSVNLWLVWDRIRVSISLRFDLRLRPRCSSKSKPLTEVKNHFVNFADQVPEVKKSRSWISENCACPKICWSVRILIADLQHQQQML